MKICLSSWAPFVAGAEIAVERLALGLMNAGHEVLLVVGTKGDALERFVNAGIRCEFVQQQFTDKWKWMRYRRSRNALAGILKRERPDLVHSNDLPTHQMTSDAASRLGIPRICHHRWIFQQTAIDWLNKYGAEQHLFVSHALMRLLCAESKRLTASNCQVDYDGLPIPTMPTEDDRQKAKCKLNLQAGKVNVLFAGQIIERKGVADTLRAWKSLPDDTRSLATLTIVGDDLENNGAYRRSMEDLAKELGVEAHFMGFQRNIPVWLTASDIVLVPSHAEPLGNATLEAMAHGRPVIGCDVGGIPEMVQHEQTGLIVPPKSPDELATAIKRLVRNADERHELGRHARQQCEARFSLQTHIETTLKFYEQVLERNRS